MESGHIDRSQFDHWDRHVIDRLEEEELTVITPLTLKRFYREAGIRQKDTMHKRIRTFLEVGPFEYLELDRWVYLPNQD